ncbi:UNVERIFIED_CONTAM: hypothetical protein GTU68_063839 [Idotea baltica]|nr:hypothetical protein [Idotea baltica]
MQHILTINNLSKTYRSGSRKLTVLDEISFNVTPGERLSIVGPSGSGKTTLLGLCAGLDRASSGEIWLCGENLRNQNVGFVFQNFQLLPTLSALENVMIPLELQGTSSAQKVAKELLDRVGLARRMNHYPSQLSGGEQQRVSLARAFSNTPKILFADEPTGNLDEDTGQHIEELLFSLNDEQGTTLIIVTHDLELAEKTDRIVRLRGGHIIEDRIVRNRVTI